MTTIPGVVSTFDTPKTDSAMMNNISVQIAKQNRLPDGVLHKSFGVTNDMVADGGVSLTKILEFESSLCDVPLSHRHRPTRLL